jgi:hypothetical protein
MKREVMRKTNATLKGVGLVDFNSSETSHSIAAILPRSAHRVQPERVYRVGGLLAVVGFVATMLARGVSESPLRSPLVKLRQDVALTRIDPVAAVRQLDVLIAGMRVVDLLDEEIRKFAQLEGQIATEARESRKQIVALESALPEAGTPFNDDQNALVVAVLNSVKQSATRTREIQLVVAAEQAKLDRRLRFLLVGGDTRKEVAAVLRLIQEEVGKSTQELGLLEKHMDSLALRLKK